jgi:hypothetical protein
MIFQISQSSMNNEYAISRLLIFFLIIVPFVEFVISEVNKEYLLCGDDLYKQHDGDINLYEWSVVKNIFSICLTILIFIYFTVSKYSIYRVVLRVIVHGINIMNVIWLIVGISLLFEEKCEDGSTHDMIVFMFFNLLFGVFGIYIVHFSMKESMNKGEKPLIDENHPYVVG